MFFFRHPRPVIDGHAVAVQVVQQRSTRETSHAVLIVEATGQEEAAAAASTSDNRSLRSTGDRPAGRRVNPGSVRPR